MISYPRLDQIVLERLLSEYRRRDRESSDAVQEIRRQVDIQVLAPGRISHSSVGGELVSEERLWQLRDSLRRIAKAHGYPERRYADRSPQWADYDRETAAALHREMAILPTDAGSREVWAHMNGWLVPDLVLWRWGISHRESEKGDPRFGWGPRWFMRNQMGRLWWRQEIMGDLYSSGRLGEDQVTALIERPSLGFNKELARTIACEWIRNLEGLTISSEDLMRDATKRIRRMLAYRALYSLPERQLLQAVRQAFDESRTVLEAAVSPQR